MTRHGISSALLSAALLTATAGAVRAVAPETIWIEAEHLAGVKGFCWPMGTPAKRKTDGHWGLSGPGWAAEWTQGGESGFLSIACAPDDDKAVVTGSIEIPADGNWHVWVRWRDVREKTARFQVRLEQPGAPAWTATYGTAPVIEEDNELKLYWDWAFAWSKQDAPLKKGPATLSLLSAFKEQDCRQIDCIVLTTDDAYRPRVKERPAHPTRAVLEGYRAGIPANLEPLARNRAPAAPPASWKPKTFRDKGFLYLWNMSADVKWAGDDPKRVPVPYHLSDAEAIKQFEQRYAGRADVPIFGDPRIVPAFHGAGPAVFATDDKDPKKAKAAANFVKWLEEHPDRPWAMMMNYAADTPVSAGARDNFLKFRDRYVGSIAGESVGYFYVPDAEMKAACANARNRRDLAEAFTKVSLATNAAKYKKVFGQDWPDAYREVIPCKSVGMTDFAAICFDWGARTVGYESSAMTTGLLSLRMAFLRGAARQNGGMTATYRSCNFGDASTIFSVAQSYTQPKNILDNYYSVYSGAGMTWYKMDIWHQYMSGSSMFYHEQGFDEFWIPGGTAAAGVKELQLSPKGKLVDRFLRVSAAHPDRGVPFTPCAFLLDYAHGWDPAPFSPHAFGDYAKRPDLTAFGDHERMLQEYFFAAYHPIAAKSEQPITATNEVYVPGVFGDIFDVVYAYPDAKRWTTIDTYPVVIAAGDIALTADEGKRLAKYVEDGGTLLVADAHLSGPGLAELKLPETGAAAESAGYTWAPTGTKHVSQRFRYKPITAAGGRTLATTVDGHVFCAAFDRGKGRLIYLSVPRGSGIDKSALPVVPQLIAHLTRGLMPVEVAGEVEWLVNRAADGWIVTLLNPAGQAKPQQGITPTDFTENKTVTIHTAGPAKSAVDWLFPTEALTVKPAGAGATIELTVPAGGVRVVELK